MRLGPTLRNRSFWWLDAVRGRPIRRHLDEIERLLEDPVARARTNRERLAGLIDHATRTTRYYRSFAGAQSLSDLPVVERSMFKTNLSDLQSESLRRTRLHPVRTSGSSGAPLELGHTPVKRARKLAEVLYFNGWAGYHVGVPYVRTSLRRRGRLQQLLLNECAVDYTRMGPVLFERLRSLLKRRRFVFLLTLPSLGAETAHYCELHGDPPDAFILRSIICSGEVLTATDRATMERVFGATVLGRYAAEEVGVLGHQRPRNGRYYLNTATYIVEILDDQTDRPVAPGERGRVVVTDLFSHAVPLIRYDLGDQAVLAEREPGTGWARSIEYLEGRTMQIVSSPAGEMISPHAVASRVMKDLSGVRRFQFAQVGSGRYVMRLVAPADSSAGPLVLERLRELLGSEAEVRIDLVDSIAPLPSGKQPLVLDERRSE